MVSNKLALNVKAPNNDIIMAVQNDSRTRFLDIVLLDGSVPLNLSNKTVRLYAVKPDNTEIYNNATIRDANAGRVEVEMTNQLLAKVGVVLAQIVITENDDEILSTLPFKINVVESLLSTSAVESTNEFGSLVVIFQDLMQAKQQMQLLVEKLGSPTGAVASNNITTVFDALNFMINYLQNNSTANIVNTVNLIKNKTDLLTNSSYGLSALSNQMRLIKGDFLGRQLKKAEVTQTKQAGVAETERTLLTLSNAIILYGFTNCTMPNKQADHVLFQQVNQEIRITVDNNVFKTFGNRHFSENSTRESKMPLPIAGSSIRIQAIPSTSTSSFTQELVEYKLTVYYYTLS